MRQGTHAADITNEDVNDRRSSGPMTGTEFSTKLRARKSTKTISTRKISATNPNHGENSLIKLCARRSLRWLLRGLSIFLPVIFAFFLASLPAYSQRGDIAANFGETTDRLGGQPRETGAIGALDGEFIVWKSVDREHGADILAGGELRWPEDASNHASEQSIYGGFAFHFGQHLSAGIHIQIHRLVPPPEFVNGLFFNRDHMELLETPGFVQYKFLPSNRAFARIEGAPEFSPRLHPSSAGAPPFINPNFDHGYAIRGVLGYSFGRWFVKGTYQTRYLRFQTNFNNPDDVYNWRSDFVTGGIGVNF
jgi:hypothetical protein